ncbi:MAG TPA: phosphoribosylamine--glycine ligase [Candidatus Saccharimonadia bacterium]|nr:phosphoribosylamine--glycine ligase [Candidatus Saccharimonadia bacterium]
MNPQNILIIGSGGREHALAWKIAQSPRLGRLYVAPGNPGTAAIATNVDLKATDKDGLVAFARAHDIGLTIVGPDDILALGLVDAFAAAGLRAFGPTQAAARIESSKAFSKQLMTTSHIPTAAFAIFNDLAAAKAHLAQQTFPLVIKASGLALGKGVYITQNLAEAEQALGEIMGDKIFGEAGSSVVIESFLTGQEVSIHAFSDGHSAALFPPAQDHKTIFDGDKGPNTGGMGAFAPVPWVEPALMERVKATVVEPALAGLAAAGSPFVGLLYPGLMVDGDDIQVLEYNARFGDPETQVYLRLLETDLMDVLDACVDGRLAELEIEWSPQTAVVVVLASPGYPGKPTTGQAITGLEAAAALPGVEIFHAGTKAADGQLLTAGGRVLGVSAVGADVADARARAYAAVKLIHFDGLQYRTDIGAKALPR